MIGPKITVDLKDLEKLTKEYPAESQKARAGRMTEALLLLQREVKSKTPVGAGPIHLRDTIFHKVNMGGTNITGILSSPLEYGAPVEYGTKPHFPPVGPLQHWVETKLGISGKEAKSVAYLIARAISRRGTKGAEMFGKGFSENEAAVMRILEQIPADIVKAVNA